MTDCLEWCFRFLKEARTNGQSGTAATSPGRLEIWRPRWALLCAEKVIQRNSLVDVDVYISLHSSEDDMLDGWLAGGKGNTEKYESSEDSGEL